LVSEPGYETVGSKDLTCEDWTLLPQIREEIHEEFRTGSGSSNAGGNPPPVTNHTWLERFNKQKPHSFEKATAPCISLRVMHWHGGKPTSKPRVVMPGWSR
nr:zinc finger, CCHC-type, retrotransposon Gag domain protein [Tanacetum cinerariifolium]